MIISEEVLRFARNCGATVEIKIEKDKYSSYKRVFIKCRNKWKCRTIDIKYEFDSNYIRAFNLALIEDLAKISRV